ncbi:MAG: c-type cytochrome [Elusimicrobiota bacterium]
MSRKSLRPALILAALLSLLVLATRRDLSRPNSRLFWDMVRSPAVHSQSASPVFADGRAMRPAPAGTVARGETPLRFGPGAEERERAGRELKNPFAPSYEVMTRGKKVFETDCQHCHGLAGLGDGAVAKAFPSFSFPLATKSAYDLPDGAIFHIITYGRNLMPAHASQVSVDDRWKVIHYLRDLQRQEIARLGPGAVIPEDPRRRALVSAPYGKELFAQNCASCHGDEGRFPKPGIPTLHSPAVLAIADDAYYADIIAHGRPGTSMPSWKAILTKTQMESLVVYIRSWSGAAPERAPSIAAGGGVERGRELFTTHCVGCHGAEGRGGIGNSLSAPSFLAMASDDFLRQTISLGRHKTAMPASYDLQGGDVDALIAYIRAWSKPQHDYDSVAALAPTASAKDGAALFAAKCAGCHGTKGEGAIGSKLSADSFLSMVDDRFLYQAITEGRSGTEMPAWRHLTAKQTADVIALIRSWQKSPSVATSTAAHHGRAEFGEVLYRQECAKCHGAQGEGDLGTQIGNPALLAQESDDFLWRTIAYGKTGTEMKGFLKRPRNPLEPEDIDHLVAFLRRLQSHPSAGGLKRTYSWASASDGKKVFETKAGCAKCHGREGEGGSGPSLGNPGFLQAASNGFLEGTIILGRENTPMHSYFNGADVPHLEQEDFENVVAYVRGFEKNPPSSRRRVEITPERVAEGRTLFRENCATCHGAEGMGKHGEKIGDFAPSLNNPEFLKAADDNFLLATIALGRPGTPMRPFGDGMAGKSGLTADQIRKIVAFLRSWEKRK